MENTRDHYFVKLSFLILRDIIQYLDNIDRVCFSLVCKRLYHNRDSYLSLPFKSIESHLSQYKLKEIYLKSYEHLIEKGNINKVKDLIVFANRMGMQSAPASPSVKTILREQFNSYSNDDISGDIEYIRIHFPWQRPLLELPGINKIKGLVAIKANAPIDCALPSNIKRMVYNCSAQAFGPNAQLPPQLESLNLLNFNQTIKEYFLPNSLQILILSTFNQEIDMNVLPPRLEKLCILSQYDKPIRKGVLPASLKTLELYSYSGKLVFFDPTNSKDQNGENDTNTYIPNNVTELALGTHVDAINSEFNECLPNTLISLEFSTYFNQTIDSTKIPSSVEKLIFSTYPANFNLLIPNGIKEVKFGFLTSEKLVDILPPSVETIIIQSYNHQEPIIFNSTVRSLEISLDYLKKYGIEQLPPTITSITVMDYRFQIKLRRLSDKSYLLFYNFNLCTIMSDSNSVNKFLINL